MIGNKWTRATHATGMRTVSFRNESNAAKTPGAKSLANATVYTPAGSDRGREYVAEYGVSVPSLFAVILSGSMRLPPDNIIVGSAPDFESPWPP